MEGALDQTRLETALVQVRFRSVGWGMGVIVLNHFVLTTADCLPAESPLQDDVLTQPVRIRAIDGTAEAALFIVGLEPCLNLAILGRDHPTAELSEDVLDELDKLMECSESVDLNLDPTAPRLAANVHLCTSGRAWGRANVDRRSDARHSFTVKPSVLRLDAKMHGGPVFDEDGRVLGIVTDTEKERAEATCLHLAAALPGWFLSFASSHQTGYEGADEGL